MQAQLAAKQAGQPAPAENPSAASTPANAPPAVANSGPPAQASPPPSATPTPAAPPPVAANPPAQQHAPTPAPHVAQHPVTKPAAFKATSGPSLLDTLASYWWAIALVVLALIGYVASRVLRSRRQSDLDDSLGRLAAAG